jgi:hypothetical protein
MRERISSMNSYQPAKSKVVLLITMKEIGDAVNSFKEFFLFDKS